MIGILGLYKEMDDLNSNRPLIYGLDRVAEYVKENKDQCKSMYDAGLTLDYAKSRVSEESLRKIQSSDVEVATEDSNLFKFDTFAFPPVNDEISKLFRGYSGTIGISGRIWYPPGGFMGWHTNSDSVGYRLYCSHASESNKSFFRFLDPIKNEVVTSWDKAGWTFRLFQVHKDVKLWHSVYSETDRVSIGYNLNFSPGFAKSNENKAAASEEEIKEEVQEGTHA